MRVCVFLGPTLDRHAARAVWDEPHYLPPVRQGDLYAAARRGPLAIGIVDGYFKGVPSVWHKEILWAMSEGIHVLGASSMGALRAAELDTFGMQGVGEVYASLERGEWEDDDEVAVVHAPAELGYSPLSEAMVNIRATLASALAQGVVDEASVRRLLELAKSRPYAERGFERLLRDADALDGANALVPDALEALRDWLPGGRVDQKAADAVTLIETLRDRFSGFASPLRVDFQFEHTEAWQRVVESAQVPPPSGSAAALALEAIKLDGTWRTHSRAALLRLVLAAAPPRTFGPEHIALTSDMLRRAHGLWRADALADWKTANGLDDRDHAELLESETRVQHAAVSTRSLDADVVRELQVRGDYAPRLAEAERVRRTLSAIDANWHERSADAVAPTLRELLADAGIAGDTDELHAHAIGLGFADVAALRRALLHRHWARAGTAAPETDASAAAAGTESGP